MQKAPDTEYGPWNPGLNSTIPRDLMPRVTLFDARHSFVTWDEAEALSEVTGLKAQELSITRPERLALHSVLIRVTSQLYVPDGPNYADLGISLRSMAQEIYDGFVVPEMEDVRATYDAVHEASQSAIDALLEDHVYAVPSVDTPSTKGFLSRFLSKPKPSLTPPSPTDRALKISTEWRDMRNEDLNAASRRAIARVLGSVLNRRGALHVDRDTIAKVAVGLVMNRLGSAAVGEAVQALFATGAEALNYRWLPAQESPVVLNAKGASASGKSSIRAAQRGIAERAGYNWQDFAIISPDYWRKALIDYDDLGENAKYAAMLCGQELEVIDKKLDLLMAVKGRDGTVPHMLIDRFRFDSFSADRTRPEDSTLLTRFGAKVFMFFVITPPAATVERAWTRGLETGRYKAVDDLLYHNIEAYTGMPDLFFKWAKGRGKWVHYEFLDNSVGRGEQPRTVAYGENGNLIVVDFQKLCDIDRYREVNVDARRAEDVAARDLTSSEATTFLRRAINELASVTLLVPGSEEVFAAAKNGVLTIDTARLPASVLPDIFGSFDEAEAPLGVIDFNASKEVVGARAKAS